MKIGDKVYLNECPDDWTYGMLSHPYVVIVEITEDQVICDSKGRITFEKDGSSWDESGEYKRERFGWHP